MTRDDADLLQGIVEVDETYVDGKPRRTNKKDDRIPTERFVEICKSLTTNSDG